MALFLLEDRDFKGFWMKIWNAGVSVITRSTFSSFTLYALLLFFIYAFSIFIYNLCMCVKKENFNSRGRGANCILLLKTNNMSTYMRLMAV
jgi:hypothetical protein